MLSSTSPTAVLLACPPSLPWNLASFTVESTLSSQYSHSALSRQSAALAHLDSLPPTIWCFGQTALFLFLLAKTALVYLPTACSSFSAEACAILQALYWSRQHQQVCHFSPFLLLSDSRHLVLFSVFPFTSISLGDQGGNSFSILLFYHATMGSGHSFLPGNDAAELARRGALLVPL